MGEARMDPITLYNISGVVLFCVALYGVLAYEHLLRKILALNLMGSGIFLLLVALARRTREPFPDPVPHALVLTGIVVAVSATALALALARRIHAETGAVSLSDAEARLQSED
jgi:multicomponent Na+:H+ antiporter subunit C